MAPTQGQWSTGLCGCTEDASSCCITCCCPCITFGQNAEIIDRGATSCVMGGAIFYLLMSVGCGCIYSCGFRTKLRAMYSLPEDPCGDFGVHCCCAPCAICQENRELKNRGYEPSLGWMANSEKLNHGGATAPPNAGQGMYR